MGRTCYYIFYVKNKVKAYLVKSDFLEMTRNNVWFCETPDIGIREREKVEEYLPEIFEPPKRFKELELIYNNGTTSKISYKEYKKYERSYNVLDYIRRHVKKVRVIKRLPGYEVYGWCKTAECDFDVLYLLNVARKISEKYGIRARFEDEGEIYYGDIVKGELKGMEISDEIIAELKEKHFKILEARIPLNIAKFFKQYPDWIDFSIKTLTEFLATDDDSVDILFGRKKGKLNVPAGLSAVKFSEKMYPFAALIHEETYEMLEILKGSLDMTEDEILKLAFRAVATKYSYMFDKYIKEVPARYLI